MSQIIPLKNARPVHPLRSLKRFAADADRLVRRHAELDELPGIVRKKMEALKSREQFDRLIANAKKTATLSQYDAAVLAQCEAALQEFDAAKYYEDDDCEGHLRRSVIGERVAQLVGAFPNGAPRDPVIYVTMMVHNVSLVDDLIMPALDAAIWQIIGTKTFLPAISEVIEIVNRQAAVWENRSWAIRDLADQSRRIVAWIEALRIAKQQP